MSWYQKNGLKIYLIKFFLFFLIGNLHICPQIKATCCQTADSKLDREVIGGLKTIESMLDCWIGPLTESINSKIDEIEEGIACCKTVRSTIDRAVVPELHSIESKLDQWIGPIADTVDSKVDVLDEVLAGLCCFELQRLILTKGDFITNGSNIIVEDGIYTVTFNTQGCITIDADNVIIDLCSFTLSCYTADAVIEILPGHNNIEIINGKLEGKSDLTNDGILTGSACELVLIDNVKIFSCDNGLNFSGSSSNLIKDCRVKNSTCKACNKGVVLDYALKTVFENCQALNCVEAGFEQTNCQFNVFENCKALQTSNADAAKGAVGFSSSAGTANLFTGCVAEGTAVTVSDANNDAIGFLLTGVEEETKIMHSIANSTSASVATSAAAYGIRLTCTKCLIENNRICNTTSGSSNGVGVFGDGSINLIARNVAYQNDTNFSGGITNVHSGDLATYDTLDNISAPYTPVPDTCCQTVNSKLDVAVVPELVSIESKLDFAVIPELISIESKLDQVVIPQLSTIESKLDLITVLSSNLDEVVIPGLQAIESKLDVVVIPQVISIESKIDVGVIPQSTSIESKLDVAVIPELISIESKLDVVVIPELISIDAKLDIIVDIRNILISGKNADLIVDGSNAIVAEGLYTMTRNVSGCVTIDADKVVVDMAGFTLSCDTADAVIEILSGHTNIEIKNGKIEGKSDLTNDGILVGSDSQLVEIENVKIFSCDNGFNFVGTESNPIKDCVVRDCVCKSCNKGALLNYAIKTKFLNCDALNCVQAGFDLTDCQFNLFDNCAALQTSNDEANERAIGFSSDDGTGNLFKECVAEGTTKTESNFCKGAIGFLLTGSEAESKIIECISNSSLIETGTGFAYGILLEPNLLTGTLGSNLKASYDYGITINEVDWSPCGRYVAMVGNNISGNELRVFRFDGTSLSLITGFDHGDDLYAVHWSPCGKYIAVGGEEVSNVCVRVFEFDGSFLTELDTYDHNEDINSVKWSPSGEYLAIAGRIASDNYNLRIFTFDGSLLTLVSNYSAVTVVFYGIDWSSSGKYIAAGESTGLRVLEFDGATVTTIDSYNPPGDRFTWSVSWSPTEKYLGTAERGGISSAGTARVLEFNGSTLSLKAAYEHGQHLYGVDWSSHVKYLAVGGVDGTGNYDLRILEFDGSSLVAVKNYNSSDSTIFSVAFLRSGQYLATGGSSLLNVFEVMYAPENCLLDSNKVCNTTGGWQQGVGINGSGDNLYLRNVGFANDVNFNKAVYNTFGLSLLESGAKKFDNLWMPRYVN
ncbi:right-handed parallel beta-helix repeat-containing protein [Candidatus Dependentiae bacterium]